MNAAEQNIYFNPADGKYYKLSIQQRRSGQIEDVEFEDVIQHETD